VPMDSGAGSGAGKGTAPVLSMVNPGSEEAGG